MGHALILDGNVIVSHAIEEKLARLGFDSFDHAYTERQALEAAARRAPDLLVVGDAIVSGSPLPAARKLCQRYGTPAMRVSDGRCSPERESAEGATLRGPFSLGEIRAVVDMARGHKGPDREA